MIQGRKNQEEQSRIYAANQKIPECSAAPPAGGNKDDCCRCGYLHPGNDWPHEVLCRFFRYESGAPDYSKDEDKESANKFRRKQEPAPNLFANRSPV